MTVRRAGDADVASLAALRRQWAAEDGDPGADDGFAEAFARWWAAERSRRVFWIAETDRPVGFLNLVVFDRMPKPGRPPSQWGYVSNVYVVADQRDAGVGRALLDAAIEHADAAGFVRIVLSPTPRSVPFYARAGFGPADSLMLRPPATR